MHEHVYMHDPATSTQRATKRERLHVTVCMPGYMCRYIHQQERYTDHREQDYIYIYILVLVGMCISSSGCMYPSVCIDDICMMLLCKYIAIATLRNLTKDHGGSPSYKSASDESSST